MARFTVIHNEPIWETTTFEVDVPEPLPEGYEDPVEWINENIADLMGDAINAETATVVQGDRVVSMDSDIEIRDGDGNVVYTDLHNPGGG